MLQLPHLIIRRLTTEFVTADKVVNGEAFGLGVPFYVMLAPMSATAAYEASGVDLQRPFMLMWGPEDPDRFPLRTLVEDDRGRLYQVSAPTVNHRFGNSADHCSTVASMLEIEPDGIERTADDNISFESARKGLPVLGENNAVPN